MWTTRLWWCTSLLHCFLHENKDKKRKEKRSQKWSVCLLVWDHGSVWGSARHKHSTHLFFQIQANIWTSFLLSHKTTFFSNVYISCFFFVCAWRYCKALWLSVSDVSVCGFQMFASVIMMKVILRARSACASISSGQRFRNSVFGRISLCSALCQKLNCYHGISSKFFFWKPTLLCMASCISATYTGHWRWKVSRLVAKGGNSFYCVVRVIWLRDCNNFSAIHHLSQLILRRIAVVVVCSSWHWTRGKAHPREIARSQRVELNTYSCHQRLF